MGEEKYGTFTWLDNDTIGMALEEILDLMNYLRYTFIKLIFMADKLGVIDPGVFAGQGHDVPLGPTAFTPTVPKEESS